MKNTTFTSAKKKVITTLTAASCILSVSAPALGSTTIGSAIFGNSIVASAASAEKVVDANNGNADLVPGRFYKSPNQNYVLVFQGDGNLVVYHYNKSTGKAYSPTWSSQTENRGGTKCVLQGDGNFVIYRKDGKAIWNTRTNGKKGAYLTFSDDGEIRVVSRNANYATTWSSRNNHGYSISQPPIEEVVKPVNGQLSAHFHIDEFRCNCGNVGTISQDLINKLETLYSRLNCSKIIVTSGYRDPGCSPLVGGYVDDAHTKGIAADVICYDKNGNSISCVKVAWEAEQIGFTGIGLMVNNAIHLDVRTTSNYKNGHWFGDERDMNNVINNIPTFKNYS
ncbi:MAG: peptidase M15 [Ruminococcus sp.]|uniref:D-Ala-D-Ala carboxypeptidase family metallohydrolase n=1 Tax=Ruminococcus sp. TaxID=41978 RepID=UPI0025EFA459|nr:D-Ala-D-Ala carboxypeptidase family metallohydrolase [Ruminococcus sp.]MBO4865852.1 peptidase M15 [Ruminococcus sp.]